MNFGVIKSQLPETPGVYLMKSASGRLLYVGKAANLKRRVLSYFERPHDRRIEKLVNEIENIEWRKTDTAIEALILEAKLIKELEPFYNIKEKDGKSFLYVEITKEKFPRVLLSRGHGDFGPFTSSSHLREALKIVRRIFPWSTHSNPNLRINGRPCFDYELGLCPGTCVGAIDAKEYRKNIKNITLFFEGKKERIVKSLMREMQHAAKKEEFEAASELRKKIFALQHIQDVALISDDTDFLETKTYSAATELKAFRIEGYDISNISGTSAVGSLVVFEGKDPAPSEYRRFKIRSAIGSNPASSAGGDVGMLKEVLYRRFARKEGWALPSLILIDGGKPQVNAAKEVLQGYHLHIPVVGIAKGPERKRNDCIGIIPQGVQKETLVRVRDEAHRFAIQYHRNLRGKNTLR